MRKVLLALFGTMALMACDSNSAEKHPATSEAQTLGETSVEDVLQHPEWSKNATIYEVNVRQHTDEGTFAAFENDIPRLHKMGVDILWLMPIHPIGEKNRKGGLGSYYSVQDYTAVNPEFGSMSDFESLVRTAHSYDMKVIIDWVANHTAFDHAWTKTNPDFYTPDSLGNIQPPIGTDWWDVADLNYDNDSLRKAMTEDMLFWVKEMDIDGFRCDVADWVPVDFWNELRPQLDAVKPVFMLAEAENPELHENAFDMTYSWELMHILNGLAKEEKGVVDLYDYMAKEDTNFQKNDYRMNFITNHDENSWNGTVFERYGDAHLAYATLAATISGMPLVYSGQEAGNPKRLRFFDKDSIAWGDIVFEDFYQKLYLLNQQEQALWNGYHGGDFEVLEIEETKERVVAFQRRKNDSHVVTLINLDSIPTFVTIKDTLSGELNSIFDQQVITDVNKGEIPLAAYGYQVFIK
jgi:cyclomaltodextrinase